MLTRATRLHSTPEPPYRPRMDRRRFLLTSLAGALAAPFAADAQEQGRTPRIGVLLGRVPGPFSEGLRHGFRELGYTEGRNIFVE